MILDHRYLIEDDEQWETVLGFVFDDAYTTDGDYSTYELMALDSVANTLGISMYDIETVSIGDNGSGQLEILLSFTTTFELTATDTQNIVNAFFAFGTECLDEHTNITHLLPGIEMLYVSDTKLTKSQKELCIVQYFSNYESNTITQWQDDSSRVNYYVGITRNAWVRFLPYL